MKAFTKTLSGKIIGLTVLVLVGTLTIATIIEWRAQDRTMRQNLAEGIGEVMEEIALASEQQTQGIEQVTGSGDEMNQVTQQNAASSEESASAAEDLSSRAAELRSLVDQFRLSSRASRGVNPFAVRHHPRLHLVQKARETRFQTPEEAIPFDDDEKRKVMGEF